MKNSNGNYECGFATDNPQWDVDDASGVNQVRSLKAYEQWVRCTMTFDWNAETFDIGLESANTTFTDSGRPMKNGIDVQYVEAWNYTGGNWGSGVDHEQWWDDFEVRL